MSAAAGPDRDAEKLRAAEWVFHHSRGNIQRAIEIELSGVIKPADVVWAINSELLAGGMVLRPVNSSGAATPNSRKVV